MRDEKVEIVSRNTDVPFKDIHPSPTGGKRRFKGKDLPGWGRTDGRESLYIHCKQCGFPFRKDKHPRGSGWGNERKDTVTDLDSTTVTTVKDPVVTGGCPFCGASEYD